MSPRGQVSLEYLLVFAAVLFFFSVMLPAVQKSYALAFFAIDVRNAERFVESIELKASELSFFSDGSLAVLEVKPLGEWTVKAHGKRLFVVVKSDSLGVEKVLEAKLPNELFFPMRRFANETVFVLRKERGLVLLENA